MWQPPRGAILAGVDGSAAALSAVRWAAHAAALRRMPLALVHVVDAPLPGWLEVPGPTRFKRRQRQRARDPIGRALKVARECPGDSGPIRIHSKVFHSAATSTLIDLSAEVEMLVVGRGRAMARSVLGSVSSALVYHARCPVAVIHDDKAVTARVAREPVLVGIDGSPASEAATAIAFEEASRRGVSLVALHAWADPRVSGSKTLFQDAKWDAQLSEEEEVLAERLAGWHERYPDVGVRRRIEIGDPARWLIEASERAQLVVVGSHGCSPVSGRLLGSVGAAVVHRAKVPVIVARQP
ncbi:universal stress protein [Mycobacterium sp. 050134]|uniref:universal stress protein n=1 Tax=Mycobacterium sp. 050134 TaxID=3096111 RepID=UPI002ED8EC68